MKKTYIIPEVEIHAICVESLIAESPFSVTKTGDTAGLKDKSATSGADALVKDNNYDVWSDDWSR